MGLGWGWGWDRIGVVWGWYGAGRAGIGVVATVYLLSFRVRKVSWSRAGEVCGDNGGGLLWWLGFGCGCLVVFVVLGWFFGGFFWVNVFMGGGGEL